MKIAILLLAAAGGAHAAPPPANAAPPVATEAPTAVDPAALEAGRVLSRLFLAGDLAAVRSRFAPAMRAQMDEAALAAFREQVARQLGGEESLVSEDVSREQGLSSYRRVARWSRFGQPVLMQWLLDDDGRVAGFRVVPASAGPQAAPSPHLERPTRARLRLPFDGDWYVYWGGRTVEQNDHAVDRGQRFAYDFVRRVDGRSHAGDGTRLEDYHCWNQPIMAPADGRVVSAVGNLPDQAIGTTNVFAPAGNHVVLDLGHDEYAFLAHLRRGSLEVVAGDHVRAGQAVGRCGNSGNTSEPHLHMHLQDTPDLRAGDGLPAQFIEYVADGSPVARGEPVQGQVVGARPTSPAGH
jgi:murein DD-endopeptidase MepM/ murein hydrolase activator NlpD